jgi:hypothetical protein
MYLVLSHVVAFCALLVNSYYDLFSEKKDVRDEPAVFAIFAGIILHSIYAFQTSSIEPVTWTLGIGLGFSLIGWISYWAGMWGGADAMAMSVLGFATPYAVSGPEILFSINILVNIMLLGFLYSLAFTGYKAIKSEEFIENTKTRIIDQKIRIGLEIIGAGLFSLYAGSVGLNPATYFVALVAVILLYRILKLIEETEMNKEIPLSEAEIGDVIISEEVELPHIREKNLVGVITSNLREKTELKLWNRSLERIESSMGYAEIVGLTEEGMEKLQESEVETVKNLDGLRFIPVFPLALIITEFYGGGLMLLLQIF